MMISGYGGISIGLRLLDGETLGRGTVMKDGIGKGVFVIAVGRQSVQHIFVFFVLRFTPDRANRRSMLQITFLTFAEALLLLRLLLLVLQVLRRRLLSRGIFHGRLR